jgi:hypothetical protein
VLRMTRLRAWLWRPLAGPPPPPPTPNWDCPICGTPVVVRVGGFKGMAGPMFAPPTRTEKVLACPQHGHPPQNNESVRARDTGADAGDPDDPT